MTTQQPQQQHQHPQPQPERQTNCADCGGTSFFATPIMDPIGQQTYDLQRCRDCGFIRWPDMR